MVWFGLVWFGIVWYDLAWHGRGGMFENILECSRMSYNVLECSGRLQKVLWVVVVVVVGGMLQI